MYVKPHEKFKSDYGVDEVRLTESLRSYLEEAKPSTLYIYSGLDSDSKINVTEPS